MGRFWGCGLVLFFLFASMSLSGQTFSALYNFGSQPNDPFNPFYAGIIAQGRDGNLYSGANGGSIGAGDLFKISPAGTLTTLYSFYNTGDGNSPYGGLTLGTDGNFYGTSYSGGFGDPPFGTVFKMTSGGSLTVLYTFTDGADGALPIAPPIEGRDGNFYGTTCNICNGPIASGFGTIYKITSSGTFSILYTCDGTHCDGMNAPLVLGTDGNFYGTSTYGGNGDGNIFKITPAGELTVLHNFDNTHGELPIGGLVLGKEGNFYGTALDGGAFGYGVVFRITPAGKYTVLHDMNGTTDGGAPYAGLVLATDGNLYGANANLGASSSGCPNGCGTLFKVTPSGAFSVLYNFDLTTGEFPYSSLVQHTNGLIYGMTQTGGSGDVGLCSTGNCGVFYSLNIGAAPFAKLVNPAAKVGGTAEILGQGFKGTTQVTFGGTSASYKVISDTFLTATVPAGATTAPVQVTTPSGTLTSNSNFPVVPQLTNFAPPSGPVGTLVTITGMSLTQTTKVTFAGVAATTFTVDSDTQVTATVPTGATSGKIRVTTPGGVAVSTTNFTVTP